MGLRVVLCGVNCVFVFVCEFGFRVLDVGDWLGVLCFELGIWDVVWVRLDVCSWG